LLTIDDIISFVKETTSEENVQADTDIVNGLGCWGDDFDEFISAYQEKYAVDMSTYRWYFHTKEEGQNFGGVFFRSPDERVQRIAITPQLLLDSADFGKWILKYPEHRLPKFRFDILINLILLGLFIFWAIRSCSK
jgi:Protein of unknown function (DUF1493)